MNTQEPLLEIFKLFATGAQVQFNNSAIKVPTYPTITQSHHILEMTWEQRMKALENDRQRIR